MLAGIPGTLGGALHTNAGTHSGDIGQWLAAATVLSTAGEVKLAANKICGLVIARSSLDDLAILGRVGA